MKRLSLRVSPVEDGCDLVDFLVQAGGMPPRLARATAEAGGVFVDGRRLSQLPARLRRGQAVRVQWDSRGGSDPGPVEEPSEPSILFEDHDLLAINKPSGMPSQASATAVSGSATAWAAQHLRLASHDRVGVAHRLDRETSGILVFGKHPDVTSRLARAFRDREVEKQYLAVAGGPLAGPGTVEMAIRKDATHRTRQTAVSEGGAPAITRYRPLSEARLATAVACWPITGRTHQIRVHLAWLGAPVVGDSLYGGPREVRLPEGVVSATRVLLHSHTLRMAHPCTGSPLELRAPPPQDLQAALALLGARLEAQ